MKTVITKFIYMILMPACLLSLDGLLWYSGKWEVVMSSWLLFSLILFFHFAGAWTFMVVKDFEGQLLPNIKRVNKSKESLEAFYYKEKEDIVKELMDDNENNEDMGCIQQ